jgi:hypothetical protein
MQISYSQGITFVPEIIGRYRIGPQQTTDYPRPERGEAILDCTIEMAQLTRTIGFSSRVFDQLVDYMIWWIFRIYRFDDAGCPSVLCCSILAQVYAGDAVNWSLEGSD